MSRFAAAPSEFESGWALGWASPTSFTGARPFSQLDFERAGERVARRSETPEVADANDPFSEKIALTIAPLEVGLAVIDSNGEYAQTYARLMSLLPSPRRPPR